jgi:hypothetical protein
LARGIGDGRDKNQELFFSYFDAPAVLTNGTTIFGVKIALPALVIICVGGKKFEWKEV